MCNVNVECRNGHILSIDIDCLRQCSSTVENLLENLNFDEDKKIQLYLPLEYNVLRKVLDFCSYHKNDFYSMRRESWEQNFMAIGVDELFALFMAADFLDIRELLNLCARTVAEEMKDKSPAEIRYTFAIEDDLSVLEKTVFEMMNHWVGISEGHWVYPTESRLQSFPLLNLPRLPLLECARQLDNKGRWALSQTCERLNTLLRDTKDQTLSREIECSNQINIVIGSVTVTIMNYTREKKTWNVSLETLKACFEKCPIRFGRNIFLHVSHEWINWFISFYPLLKQCIDGVMLALYPEKWRIEGSGEVSDGELQAVNFFLNDPSIYCLMTARSEEDPQWNPLRRRVESWCESNGIVYDLLPSTFKKRCGFYRKNTAKGEDSGDSEIIIALTSTK